MAEQYLSQTQEQRLQMILAPQLRQSLELLQVPALELRSLIQQELQSNPTLEEKPLETTQVEVEPGAKDLEPGVKEPEDDKTLDFKEEFDVLARLDDEWKEYFQQSSASHPYSADDAAKRQFFLDSLSQTLSLQDHLMNQLALSGFDPDEVKIGEMIIGSINDDGYLATPLEELAHATGHPREHLESMLATIQEFDPIGVGARDLKECLLLQLNRLGKGNSPAALIVQDHLDALGAKKFPVIAKALKITPEEVQDIARFIATLEPKPGRLFASESPAYVLPELVIQKTADGYTVVLNRDQVPHLRISKHYRQLMESADTTAEVKDYIREKVRAGAFLIKSIQQRQQTIYRIATEIVRVQKDFFDHGLSHLKPLTMSVIAGVLGIHETTVSRAIANKYAQTPRGTFEMKYFFTPGMTSSNGTQISNKTIKDSLAQMISNEDPAKPFSDQEIVEKFREQGLKIARRTIAKYRDELRILPSHLRKTF